MSKEAEFTFRLEMQTGQEIRVIIADSYFADELWIKFNRRGELYWMANRDHVVSMESSRNV